MAVLPQERDDMVAWFNQRIEQWEAEYGPIPAGAWVLLRTGWSRRADPAAFPWFGSPRHWESVIVQLQEQLVALREPVLDLSAS